MTEQEMIEELKTLNETTSEFFNLYKDRINGNKVLSFTEHEEIKNMRKEIYAGSGILNIGALQADLYRTNIPGVWSYYSIDGCILGNYNKDPEFQEDIKLLDPHFLIGGDRIKLKALDATNQNYIPSGKGVHPVLVSDTLNLPEDVVQGDSVLVTTETDIISDNGLTSNVNCEITVSGREVTVKPTSDHYYCSFTISTVTLKDNDYVLDIDLVSDTSNINKFGVIGENGYTGKYIYGNKQSLGNHKVFIGKDDNATSVVIANPDWEAGREIKFVVNSIKPRKAKHYLVTKPISKGSSLVAHSESLEPTDDITRRDMVIMEKWDEKISDKDFVYPYGNVKYGGYTVDGLPATKLVKDVVTDYRGLSNIHRSVYGYKWSTLTSTEQLMLATNPDNNIYLKDQEWYQVRYRVRVIRGTTGELDFIPGVSKMLSYSSDSTVCSIVSAQGEEITIPNIDDLHVEGDNVFDKQTDFKGTFGVSRGSLAGKVEAISLFMFQRANIGIYHPIFNPFGCGKLYKDGSPVEWNEGSEELTSTEDCFDKSKMCAVRRNNGAYEYLTGDSITTSKEYLIGSVKQGLDISTGVGYGVITGGLDSHCDGMHKVDILDLRMDSRKKSKEGILEDTWRGLLTGELPIPSKSKGIDYITEEFAVYTVDKDKVTLVDIEGRGRYSFDKAKGFGQKIFNKTRKRWFFINSYDDWSNTGLVLSTKRGVLETDTTKISDVMKPGDICVVVYERELDFLQTNNYIAGEVTGDITLLDDTVKYKGSNFTTPDNLVTDEIMMGDSTDLSYGSEGCIAVPLARPLFDTYVYARSYGVYSYTNGDNSYVKLPSVISREGIVTVGTSKGTYNERLVGLAYINHNGDSTLDNVENKINIVYYRVNTNGLTETLNDTVIKPYDRARLLSNLCREKGGGLAFSLTGMLAKCTGDGFIEPVMTAIGLETDGKFSTYSGDNPYVPQYHSFEGPFMDGNNQLMVFPYLSEDDGVCKLNVIFNEHINGGPYSGKLEIGNNTVAKLGPEGHQFIYGQKGMYLPYYN